MRKVGVGAPVFFVVPGPVLTGLTAGSIPVLAHGLSDRWAGSRPEIGQSVDGDFPPGAPGFPAAPEPLCAANLTLRCVASDQAGPGSA